MPTTTQCSPLCYRRWLMYWWKNNAPRWTNRQTPYVKETHLAAPHHAYSRQSHAYFRWTDYYDKAEVGLRILEDNTSPKNWDGIHCWGPRSMAIKDLMLELDWADDGTQSRLNLRWVIHHFSSRTLKELLQLNRMLSWFIEIDFCTSHFPQDGSMCDHLLYVRILSRWCLSKHSYLYALEIQSLEVHFPRLILWPNLLLSFVAWGRHSRCPVTICLSSKLPLARRTHFCFMMVSLSSWHPLALEIIVDLSYKPPWATLNPKVPSTPCLELVPLTGCKGPSLKVDTRSRHLSRMFLA